MSEYQVLWPLGRKTMTEVNLNRHCADDRPRRFGFLWDFMFRGNDMFPLLEAGLTRRYPGSTFVSYEYFGNVHGADEREVLAALPERLREAQVDTVIVGVGA